MTTQTRFLIAMTGVAASLMLGACSMDSPSKISPTARAEVYQDSFTIQEDTTAVTANMLAKIGNHYRTNGTGPVHVSVIYDPYSKTSTAMKAADQSKRIAGELRNVGVADIRADTMPIQQSGDVSQTMISFATIMAAAPTECGGTLGRATTEITALEDYQLGCSVETYMAKQIARPKDLLGNDTMDNVDGRRAANVLENYQSGKPNEELQGELATDD